MIVSFYKAGLQVLVSGKEGLHLFPRSQDVIYVKITGRWETGLDIVASNEDDYNQRPDDQANYYKPSITMGRSDQLCVITVGWRVLGDLHRDDYNMPCRGILETTLTQLNGKPVVRVKPLATMEQHPNSQELYAKGRGPVAKAAPVAEPVAPFLTPETTQAPPSPPPSMQPPPIVAPPPLQQAKVASPQPSNPAPTPRPHIQGSKSAGDLKQLAAELNKSLETVPGLFVSFVDGRLVLEEEIEVLEEF
jgi:hypothetical protein